MSQRGTAQKSRNAHFMRIQRAMVTRNYALTWDLDRCVGCQICPIACPKDALTHIPAELENGRIVRKPSVDVDETKCVNCGICVVMCPTHAIQLTINGKKEVPVQEYEAFPELIAKTIFKKEHFDFSKKDFVIHNCSAELFAMTNSAKQCVSILITASTAANAKLLVKVPSRPSAPPALVELHRERCEEGCLACADVCPTRALHIQDGKLVLPTITASNAVPV